MSTIITAGAVFTIHLATSQQVIAQNRFFLTRDTGWDAASVESMLADIETSWGANIAPVTVTTVELAAVTGQIASTDPWGIPFQYLLESPTPGTLADDPIPWQNSATIRFLPGAGSAVARGYNRFIGLGEDDVTGNQVSSTKRTALQNAYGQFFADLITADPDVLHVIVSLYDGFTLSPVQPDGTIHKVPTPRVTALTSAVEGYRCAPTVGRAVSRSGIRA